MFTSAVDKIPGSQPIVLSPTGVDLSRAVLVAGLPMDVTENDVIDVLSFCGPLRHIAVGKWTGFTNDEKKLVMSTNKSSDDPSGDDVDSFKYACLVYKTGASKDAALLLNGTTVIGSTVTIVQMKENWSVVKDEHVNPATDIGSENQGEKHLGFDITENLNLTTAHQIESSARDISPGNAEVADLLDVPIVDMNTFREPDQDQISAIDDRHMTSTAMLEKLMNNASFDSLSFSKFNFNPKNEQIVNSSVYPGSVTAPLSSVSISPASLVPESLKFDDNGAPLMAGSVAGEFSELAKDFTYLFTKTKSAIGQKTSSIGVSNIQTHAIDTTKKVVDGASFEPKPGGDIPSNSPFSGLFKSFF